jgi:hypothetical protein
MKDMHCFLFVSFPQAAADIYAAPNVNHPLASASPHLLLYKLNNAYVSRPMMLTEREWQVLHILWYLQLRWRQLCKKFSPFGCTSWF